MSSTNQSPFYKRAEAKFLEARTNEEKITSLKEMIRECPKHKSSEKMLANLKTRLKKLLEQQEKSRKKGLKKSGIKKEDMQAAIVGLTNSGKSTLISALTNISPKISPFPFTTKKPVVGMMPFLGTQIQLVEIPAIESENYDKGVVHTADVILIIIKDLKEIFLIEKELQNSTAKKIIIFNNINKTKEEIRKISSTLQSKKYRFLIVDAQTPKNLDEIKNKLFLLFEKLRIFTKEPGKEKAEKPMILEPGSTIKTIAKKVLKNLKSLKETRIWGPSSKFSGQVVGLTHKLKDLDVVEFKTR